MDYGLILASVAEPTFLEGVLSKAWSIGSVAVGLGFVIFVHELGHFLVAKACGVKCEKFYIGFDWFPIKKIGPFTIPTSIWKRQIGETVYGIGILPLGGYVKMLGQDDDPRNAQAEAERTKVLQDGTAAEGFTPGTTVEGKQGQYVLDPRSYPAKSVPARMAIISAGVIMNIIFGVIFGMFAYKLGVPEVPAVIGETIPGDPAWMQLRPGMKILQFSKTGWFGRELQPYEKHRFEDTKRNVVFSGHKRDLELLIRDRDNSEKWYVLRPSDRTTAETGFPSLGFRPPTNRHLGLPAGKPANLLAKTEPPIEDRDVVVAIEGESLDANQDLFDPKMSMLLAQRPNQPITLTIERAEKKAGETTAAKDAPKKRFEVVVQPRGIRELGLVMKPGPIAAVRPDSPADKAGLKAGDVIETINGEPVGNPLSLDQRLRPAPGENPVFQFVVSRPDAKGKPKSVTISVTAETPDQFHDGYFSGGPVGVESVGIALGVTSEVALVTEGSPAHKAKLAPGDEITAVKLIPKDKAAEDSLVDAVGKSAREPLELNAPHKTWTRVHSWLQVLPPDTSVELTLTRAGKTQVATLAPTTSTEFFDESRGLDFYTIVINHQAESWSEALGLGAREVKERMGEVVTMVGKLLTGEVALKNLSGPGGILYMAGSFAEQGLAPLLMFLTLLSANLAVMNFLPIPVLDGGHMLFLAYEGIRRKPVDPNVQGYLSLAGLLLLLSLMIFATVMDVGRFFN